MYVEHGSAGASCSTFEMLKSLTEPPRTFTILPAYCSGCWYSSQRLTSMGFVASWPIQNPLRKRMQRQIACVVIFIVVYCPAFRFCHPDGSPAGWSVLDPSQWTVCLCPR